MLIILLTFFLVRQINMLFLGWILFGSNRIILKLIVFSSESSHFKNQCLFQLLWGQKISQLLLVLSYLRSLLVDLPFQLELQEFLVLPGTTRFKCGTH